jgi:xanthine dehydrogenase large subunit
VHAVLSAEDIPGAKKVGAIIHDEPLLALGEVHFRGQAVAFVVAEDLAICRAAAAAVVLEIEESPSLLDMASAIAASSYHTTPHTIARGDVSGALSRAMHVIEGEVATGGQDHFYLETHAALVEPQEQGCYRVYSSTQHPSEVQACVAEVLGLGRHQVVCEVPRVGGGFGGKESQASQFAALAALGALHTGRAVKVWLDRDSDMIMTGKRHPFFSRYRAGFDAAGMLTAFEVDIYSDGGWTIDLSDPVMDRALFHLDNAYYIPNLRFTGLVCRTNLPSNTAFRGFGGPQGMVVVEEAINRFAERTGEDPAEVRHRNFYGGDPRDRTPFGQEVTENRLPRIWKELMASSEYRARRTEIERFNRDSKWMKRGIAFQPIKFGISFTKSLLNQAGALVLVYADGTVQLNHGGTEMGQGLHTKMRAVCAHELGVDLESVRVMHTATDKVPNTSATAASSGTDLNGAAVQLACQEVAGRMAEVAAEELGLPVESIQFADGLVGTQGGKTMAFGELATQCWLQQVSLSATGYYATPGIVYDRDAGRGTPFYYFAYGGAVCEVEVHGLTGEHRLLRVDILHDVGNPLVPNIDIGQVEGAFVQGQGWLTSEEVSFGSDGRLLTHSPSTYKIPSAGDAPEDFRTALLERAANDKVVGGSKAVGEPPFMLAISLVTALRHAIGAFGPAEHDLELTMPCTPEAILRSVEGARKAWPGVAAR